MKRICVFCGSGLSNRPEYAEAARKTGEEIAKRGYALVYGGAKVGLMGLVADATLAQGGEVIGILPEILMSKERAHAGLTTLHLVGSMHERKAKMAEMSDAFVALPGGMGTFEEFCEIVTWSQLGLHSKPCGLLNIAGYYDPLLTLIARAISDGLMRADQRGIIVDDTDVATLLDRFTTYIAPPPSIQITRSQS